MHEDDGGEHRDAEEEDRGHADRVVASAEEVQGDDRLPGSRLDEDEDQQEHDAEPQQPAHVEVGPVVQLPGRGVDLALVGEADEEGHHARDEDEDPGVVEVSRARGRQPPVREQRCERHQRRHPEGHVDVEDPVPADVVGDPPADEGPGQEAESEHGAEETRVAAALTGGEEVADGRHGHRHDGAGPQALQRPESDQLLHVLREPGEPGAGQEQADAEQEHGFASVDVGELAVDGDRHRRAQQVGRDHPDVDVGALQIGDDPRQGRPHHGLVERGEEHRQEDGAKDGQSGAVVDGDRPFRHGSDRAGSGRCFHNRVRYNRAR